MRREKHVICMFHKIVHGHLLAYISNLLPKLVHQRCSIYFVMKTTISPSTLGQMSFKIHFYYSVHSWNLLNPDIKNIEDVQFKRELFKNSCQCGHEYEDASVEIRGTVLMDKTKPRGFEKSQPGSKVKTF